MEAPCESSVVADQWGARQLIQRLRASGVSIRETTVGAAYHDSIARFLMDLSHSGLVRIPPHDALQTQLRSVVLKRSQASSRDDATVRVRIDSGAGAGVAGKDDLVVALAGACFEHVGASNRGPLVAWITNEDIHRARIERGYTEPRTVSEMRLRLAYCREQDKKREARGTVAPRVSRGIAANADLPPGFDLERSIAREDRRGRYRRGDDVIRVPHSPTHGDGGEGVRAGRPGSG